MNRFQQTSKENRSLRGQMLSSDGEKFATFKQQIISAVNDDLNSAAAFALIDENLNNLQLLDWSVVEALFALNISNIDKDAEYEKLDNRLQPLIKKRNEARENKDYETADKIRDELKAQNLTLLDTEEGTLWQFTD